MTIVKETVKVEIEEKVKEEEVIDEENALKNKPIVP